MSDEVRQETAIHWRAYGDYEPVSPDDEDPQELIDQLPGGPRTGAGVTGPLRILVTGSRKWRDRRVIRDALTAAWRELGYRRPLVVVHGGAPGADAIAHEWADLQRTLGLPVQPEPHPADWDRHGKAAGHIRNAEMVALGADLCLAFPIGESRGTRGCMRLALRAGIPLCDLGAAS